MTFFFQIVRGDGMMRRKAIYMIDDTMFQNRIVAGQVVEDTDTTGPAQYGPGRW